MIRLHARLCALAAAVLLLCGCETLKPILGDILANTSKPSASIERVRLDDIRADGLDLVADVKVENPYPVPLYAKQLGFELFSADARILSGASNEPMSIGAKSADTVPVTLKVPFRDVLATLRDVKPGSVIPFTTKFDVNLAGESIAPLNFKLEKSGEMPVPAVPEVQVKGLKWDELNLSSAKGNLALSLKNTNQFPVNLAGLDYHLKLGGQEISTGQLAEQALKLQPGETGDVNLQFGVRPQDMGLAAFRMLSNKEADFEIKGLMNTETPFGPMKLDFEKSGKTASKK